jgi:hypothetical protein
MSEPDARAIEYVIEQCGRLGLQAQRIEPAPTGAGSGPRADLCAWNEAASAFGRIPCPREPPSFVEACFEMSGAVMVGVSPIHSTTKLPAEHSSPMTSRFRPATWARS